MSHRMALVSLCVVCLTAMVMSGMAQTSTATVVFYRYNESTRLKKPSIFCDGHQVVRMAKGRFAKVQFQAGKHLFTSNFPGNGIELNLAAGDVYYIRLALTEPTAMHGSRGQIFAVPKEQAEYEITQLEQLAEADLKWGKSGAEVQKNKAR